MTISIVSHASAQGSGTSASVSEPAGAQTGDVLIGHCFVHNTSSDIGVPSGWETNFSTAGTQNAYTSSKVIITPAASHAFPLSATSEWTAGIVCLRGVKRTPDFHWRFAQTVVGGQASSTTLSLIGGASAENGELRLCFADVKTPYSVSDIIPPSGDTELYQVTYDDASKKIVSNCFYFFGAGASTANPTADVAVDYRAGARLYVRPSGGGSGWGIIT